MGDDESLQSQLDDLKQRVTRNWAVIDALVARADIANDRADQMEARVELDREMIAELQTDGLLSQEHAEHMEQALRSSHTIGAAVGMIMVSRQVSEDQAFAILREASQHSNRKLRDIADDLVHQTDATDLPLDA